MATTQTKKNAAKKAAKTPKADSLSEKIEHTISAALAHLKEAIGEKKLAKRIKRAAKLIAKGHGKEAKQKPAPTPGATSKPKNAAKKAVVARKTPAGDPAKGGIKPAPKKAVKAAPKK